jgi:hypothetical protein
MALSLPGHLCSFGLLQVRSFGNVLRGGYLRGLSSLSIRHRNFQTIEHISYTIKEILDHERRFDMRERDVLGCLDVLAQLGGRGMGINDSYAKADECMHLTGEELYIFAFPRIRHKNHPVGLSRTINASGASRVPTLALGRTVLRLNSRLRRAA